jgi:hypothetical protein
MVRHGEVVLTQIKGTKPPQIFCRIFSDEELTEIFLWAGSELGIFDSASDEP